MGSRSRESEEESGVLGELQQLGHMVQVLSYELTVLQDFMKENYGPRFGSYRKQHLSAEPSRDEQSPSPGHMSVSNKNIRIIRIRSSKVKAESTVSERGRNVDDSVSEDEEAQDNEDDAHQNAEDNLSAMQMDDNLDEDKNANGDPSRTHMDENESMDSNDNYQTLEVQDQEPSPSSGNRGKPRSAIWKKYIISKSSDGKTQAKCPKCLTLVSSKVERLEGHFRKCVLGKKSSMYTPEEEENKRRVKQLIKDKKSSPSKIGSSLMGLSRCNKGRKMDPVWSYFNMDEADGKRTVTCKTCNVEVSAKVERVRKHFILCHELDMDKEPEPKGSGSKSNVS